MKSLTKQLILAFTAPLCLTAATIAQNRLQPIVDMVIDNDPIIKARTAELNALWLDTRAENRLEDPEFDFDHFWGSKSTGRKYTLGISQSFDLPTAYRRRSQHSEAVREAAEAAVRQLRAERSADIREALYEYAFNKAMVAFTASASQRYEKIAEYSEEATSLGAVTKVDLQRARLELMSARRRNRQAEADMIESKRKLAAMNGGVELSDSLLSDLSLPGVESLLPLSHYTEAAELAPSVMTRSLDLKVEEKAAGVAKAERLPKFSLGYAYNNEFGESFHGISGSVTLPVYSRRSRLEAAKAKCAAIESDITSIRSTLETDVNSAYRQALMLKSDLDEYSIGLKEHSIGGLLDESLEAGLITVTDYLRDIGFEVSMAIEQIECRYEFATALNRLQRLVGE